MARLFQDPEWIGKVRAAETAGEVLDTVKAVEQRHC